MLIYKGWVMYKQTSGPLFKANLFFFFFFSHMTLCEEGSWEEGMEGLAFEPGSGMPSGMKLGSEAKNSYL